LSRGNGAGEKGEVIVFVMEGEDILGNARTMDAIILYLGANFVPNTTGRKNKRLQHRGSGHSTTGLHPAKAGMRWGQISCLRFSDFCVASQRCRLARFFF